MIITILFLQIAFPGLLLAAVDKEPAELEFKEPIELLEYNYHEAIVLNLKLKLKLR